MAEITAFVDDDGPLPSEELINMANVLIVSGSYFPNATANAVCVKRYEDILKRNGHHVFYCNRKHDLFEPDFHIYEGTELHTVGKNSDIFYQTYEKLCRLDLPNGMRFCANASYHIFRMLMKLINFGRNSGSLRKSAINHYLDKYSDRIVSLVETENVDVIMSVSMPFMSHLAVLQAMRKLDIKNISRPKWIAYSIDAYWSKAGINPKDIPAMKTEENDIFRECDLVLFLDTIKKDYSGKDYDIYRNKMLSLPLPTFDIQNNEQYQGGFSPVDDKLNFLFTGTIYDDFSNIESLDSILRKSSTSTSAIHFMGKIYPKSLKLLEQLANDRPNQIFIYGRKSYDFAKASMQKADILINLANDNSNQIPSKIFEYIACRKPILNIYKLSNDVGTEYLKKYPLAFNFNVNDMDNELVRLNQWLETVKVKSVSYDELRDIYKDILTDTVTADFYKHMEKYL
ncbi:MAG: hypothetical protein NC453_13080 [Muribaculum sp.]|nr:hypothetical protein [Muribaculum sp.]